MTAFALTHSDRFALGIAGSGVYDWGMYDTIYTERYMSTPQKNPEGYKAASVIEAAKDLGANRWQVFREVEDLSQHPIHALVDAGDGVPEDLGVLARVGRVGPEAP